MRELLRLEAALKTFKVRGRDVPINRLEAFIAVAMEEGIAVGALAERMGEEGSVGATHALKIVDILVRLGLVRKEKDEADRRLSLVYLTREGRDLADKLKHDMAK
eukprot:TRINITY_DN81385_c0_g1_i1.p1 TRINITY_DN81385_c0_g1~~TRINITY_DN81385_c0_g1_i1.p1  ORF type:complete len:105 (-),score=7.94 TRINITY_DN81385_c0_g1_i1:257-571(-)